jgi:hypothetical protein
MGLEWSFSTDRRMRRCQRQLFLATVAVWHNAKDPLRRESFLLSQVKTSERVYRIERSTKGRTAKLYVHQEHHDEYEKLKSSVRIRYSDDPFRHYFHPSFMRSPEGSSAHNLCKLQ